MFMKSVFPPNTSFAGSWLGAPAYFSDLYAVDLLGKVDKHVAHSTPFLRFMPGHNKMDLDYSLGTLQPDMVLLFAGLALAADAPRAYGYFRWHEHIWLRPSYFEKVKDLPSIRNPRCPGASTIDACLQGIL